jgi:hypothetical protein
MQKKPKMLWWAVSGGDIIHLIEDVPPQKIMISHRPACPLSKSTADKDRSFFVKFH